MEPGESRNFYKEPYRATKLWLSSIALFHQIPVSKHRRQWKSYEDTFTAAEAITWLHDQLHEHFQISITRKQTVQLLQKFYKAGVFTSTSSRANTVTTRETDFKDNTRLYRLLDCHSNENESSPGSSNKSKDNYTVVIKPLTTDELHTLWEQVYIERFVTVLGYDVFSSFLKPGNVQGRWILHNMTRIGQYGIVLNASGGEELPIWLLHAMKCLANWPHHHTIESTIPNYPNFEHDVFKLIRDYFSSYKDTSPLLTHDLYDAFISTFIRAELFDFNTRLGGGLGKAKLPTGFKKEEQYPFNASESVENLILELLTPSEPGSGFRRGNRIKPKRIFGENFERPQMPQTILGERNSVGFEPMPDQSYNMNRYTQPRLPNPFFYETAFTNGNSPITRVVSQTELQSSTWNVPLKPRPSRLSTYAYENPNLQLSPADLIHHPKYSRVLEATKANLDLEYSFLDYKDIEEDGSWKNVCPFQGPARSQSAADLSDACRDRSPYAPMKVGFAAAALRYANSPCRAVKKTLDFYYGADACVPGLMTAEGKELAVTSFRLLTLLLPAKNRRHLQLLLRCMAKMSRNEKLRLDVALTSRDLVINTFFRCILSSAVRAEFDELLALRIVTFMMDNDSAIFDVKDEECIKGRAEELISEMQIVKIPVSDSQSGVEKENEVMSACSRITLDEYDDQRLLATTSKSLRDLLDTYDQVKDEKERKKRLNEFRNEYPHIFFEKFGDSEPLEASTTEKKNPFRLFKFRF